MDKKVQIKTKKANLIIFNQDYICIDGNYMIHKDYCELDNPVFQQYINENKPFKFHNKEVCFNGDIPKLAQLLPTKKGYELADTHMLELQYDCNILAYEGGDNAPYYTFIYKDFYNMINKQNVFDVNWWQIVKLGLVVGYDKEENVAFGIMPQNIRSDYYLRMFEE